MQESVMRQGMSTWLKKECVDVGKAYILISKSIDNIAEEMVCDKKMVPSYVDMLKSILTKSESFGIIEEDEPSEIMAVVDSLVNKNNPIQLGDYADRLHIKALEKTVVCQCGKPTESISMLANWILAHMREHADIGHTVSSLRSALYHAGEPMQTDTDILLAVNGLKDRGLIAMIVPNVYKIVGS